MLFLSNHLILDKKHLISDIEILQLLQSKDEASKNKGFMHLYQSYYKMISSFVTKSYGQEQDVEDVFQETLLVLYHNLCHKKIEIDCSLSTYLFAIAKNIWWNKNRNKKTIENFEIQDDQEFVDQKNIEEVLHDNEKSKTIAQLMESLGPSCRNTLALYYYEKMTMKQIAEALQLKNEQVARNKKAKCLAKLKEIILSSELYKSILK